LNRFVFILVGILLPFAVVGGRWLGRCPVAGGREAVRARLGIDRGYPLKEAPLEPG